MIDMTAIQAKSDQMNAVDFVKPMIFKIEKVVYNPRNEQPIHLHLNGCEGRPFKPCKSMLRGLCSAWSMDEAQWEGKLIELYCDPSVKWAGKEAGGIRISGVSGIKKEHAFTVTLNRSQRTIHKFRVLDDTLVAEDEFILTHWEDRIKSAKEKKEVNAIFAEAKSKHGDDKSELLKPDVLAAHERLSTE